MNKPVEKCYYCSSIANSREHVPPLCFFPENKDLPPGMNLRKHLITVPACDLHNHKKSKDDEYLLYTIVMNLNSNPTGLYHFFTKIMRSIERDRTLAKRMFSGSKPARLKDSDSGAITRTQLVQIEENRINNVIDLILRGLHFHHFGERWLGDIRICPEFLLSIQGADIQQRNADVQRVVLAGNTIFVDVPKIGHNPQIFTYHFADGSDQFTKIARLYFYGGTRISALFIPHA